MEEETIKSFSFTRSRKWAMAFNVILSSLALLALIVMVNYLAARHFWRIQVDSNKTTLCPLTKRVLNSLSNHVKIIIYFDTEGDRELFSSVKTLLKEYEINCPKLDLEFVDYKTPGRAELIQAQYKFATTSGGGRVIFDYKGRAKTVMASELSEYESAGKEFRRSAFKGELLFTSAIASVTEAHSPKVYFLQGHGEHDPASEDDTRGYSKFAKSLNETDVEYGLLGDLTANDIPADCQVLIIAGPDKTLLPEEVARIDQYLSRGGRVFLLLNFQSALNPKRLGFEQLLASWNLDTGLNYIQDKSEGKAKTPQAVIASSFGTHPIVKPLRNSSLVFYIPRSVGQKSAVTTADSAKVAELVSTSSSGVVYSNAKGEGGPDKQGVFPLAAAAEKGSIQGVSADRGVGRLVVTGDSIFLANYLIEYLGNRDFGMLAVNWLLNRDLLLSGIPARAVKEYKFNLTEQQMSTFRWVFLLVVPGLVMMTGFGVWLRRRY